MSTTETVTVRMSRSDPSTIWGFRLHGGKEFSTPLVISKVTERSLSERAGLKEGDQVVSISGRSAASMFHKEAQEAIFACGDNVELVVQRY
ncbi:unnamed protein product [Soboliphyme baturini]|uniref:PDZ domain-containing protein n=1 Tax=Soboliphyme baturini TaxID=241478 RepID=A0A183IS10_9BILA|nr:unnamed protein product [Soboliphyme baturini]